MNVSLSCSMLMEGSGSGMSSGVDRERTNRGIKRLRGQSPKGLCHFPSGLKGLESVIIRVVQATRQRKALGNRHFNVAGLGAFARYNAVVAVDVGVCGENNLFDFAAADTSRP